MVNAHINKTETKNINLIIDKRPVSVPEGTTILDAAKKCGINIPTLCYLRDINEIGACRVCLVEIEGGEKLVTACNTMIEEGMVVYTNSKRVRSARRTNIRLILSQHDANCPNCTRNGNCTLQSLCRDMNITDRIYEKKLAENDAPGSFPLIKEAAKCIKCMRCINVCDKIQSVNAWELRGTGARAAIGAAGGKTISESGCTLCGQCITHCPVAALKERSDEERVIAALGDPDLITVIQIAPAVRAAWAESMKLTAEKANVGRLVSLTRALGFNYVFDTDFSADLTVMEETSELIERLKSGKKYKYPLFTSCCPAWVTFAKERFPDAAENLSSTKSPQQMFGAAVKGYFAGLIGENPSKIFSVSVMPCLAKKKEAADSPNAFENGRDVDAVITTRELARMITSANHDVEAAEEENFDSPLGLASGAGVIFGTTGGVSEAVLRTAYYFITGKNPSPDCFSNVRENDNGMRKYTIDIAGAKVSLGIASGLRNARRLIEMIESGEEHFDIVEIMACPGGCSGGGGQPIHDGFELAAQRAEILKTLDCSSEIRFAHENPSIKRIYDEYYGAPLSEKAHAELHTK